MEALLFRRDLAVLHAQEALTALMQKKSETPLILAARGGHSEACLLLLRYPNIDVNVLSVRFVLGQNSRICLSSHEGDCL